MSRHEEFQSRLEALFAGMEDYVPGHPSQEELVDYHRGGLPEERREQVQTHLLRCHGCLALLKEVADFFDGPRDGETFADAPEAGRLWPDLWRRLGEGKVLREPGSRPAYALRTPLLAVAASLLAALALAVLGSLWLLGENRRLAAQLDQLRRETADRLDQVEKESGGFRGRAQELESLLAQSNLPDLNVPVYDVFSKNQIERSGDAAPINRLQIPPDARRIILILSGAEQRQYPVYSIEILDDQDRKVWQGEGLTRSGHGSFTVALSRDLLNKGRYRLLIRARDGDRSQIVAEYLLQVE